MVAIITANKFYDTKTHLSQTIEHLWQFTRIRRFDGDLYDGACVELEWTKNTWCPVVVIEWQSRLRDGGSLDNRLVDALNENPVTGRDTAKKIIDKNGLLPGTNDFIAHKKYNCSVC